jgi:transposase InsO family protein
MHPNEDWVVGQAESLVRVARARGIPVWFVQHDRDTKFTRSFDAALKRYRLKVIRGAYRSPNTNAFVERFIQSIAPECLDRFVVFGERPLDYLCAEYLAHYHSERAHQSLDNEPVRRVKRPGRPSTKRGRIDDEIVSPAEVTRRMRLGGSLKHYERKAG